MFVVDPVVASDVIATVIIASTSVAFVVVWGVGPKKYKNVALGVLAVSIVLGWALLYADMVLYLNAAATAMFFVAIAAQLLSYFKSRKAGSESKDAVLDVD